MALLPLLPTIDFFMAGINSVFFSPCSNIVHAAFLIFFTATDHLTACKLSEKLDVHILNNFTRNFN